MGQVGRMYGGPEAARRAGCSYRQLDYWARKGLLGPDKMPGSGVARLFRPSEVIAARIYRTISALMVGMTPGNSGFHFDQRFDGLPVVLEAAYQDNPALLGYWMMVEPSGVSLVRVDQGPLQLSEGGAFVLDLESLVGELDL